MPGSTGDEREAIIRAIADTEKVADEQAERERQLSELRTRLAEWNEPIPRSAALSASPTMRPDTKVELFLSLFRARFVRKRDGLGSAGSTAIVAALNSDVPPMRTVQRRLQKMVRERTIVKNGARKMATCSVPGRDVA